MSVPVILRERYLYPVSKADHHRPDIESWLGKNRCHCPKRSIPAFLSNLHLCEFTGGGGGGDEGLNLPVSNVESGWHGICLNAITING